MQDTYAARPFKTGTRETAFYSRGYGQRNASSNAYAAGAFYPFFPFYGVAAFAAACGCDTLTYSSGGCGAGETLVASSCCGLPIVRAPQADVQPERVTYMGMAYCAVDRRM